MRSQRLVALFVAVALTPAVGAQGPAAFAGKWSGPWTNSLGEKGESKLTLAEADDGAVKGVWDGIPVSGKRVNKTTVELQGKNKTRSYQMTATLSGGEMTVHYLVTRLDGDGAYEGKATLRYDR